MQEMADDAGYAQENSHVPGTPALPFRLELLPAVELRPGCECDNGPSNAPPPKGQSGLEKLESSDF